MKRMKIKVVRNMILNFIELKNKIRKTNIIKIHTEKKKEVYN